MGGVARGGSRTRTYGLRIMIPPFKPTKLYRRGGAGCAFRESKAFVDTYGRGARPRIQAVARGVGLTL